MVLRPCTFHKFPLVFETIAQAYLGIHRDHWDCADSRCDEWAYRTTIKESPLGWPWKLVSATSQPKAKIGERLTGVTFT